MKARILKSLALVAVLASFTSTALAQYGKPIYCPPTNPTPSPWEPPYYTPQPTPQPQPMPQSYFLGVYTSKVQVAAYGGALPTPPPGYGPMMQRNRVGVNVVPGAGQPVFGMRINKIVPNSPAQFAGLEPGDILLDGNGFPMDSRADLQHAINTSNGVLEMKVLDGRTGQLMWVVAQTQTQNITPQFTQYVQMRRSQAAAKNRGIGGHPNPGTNPGTNPGRVPTPGPGFIGAPPTLPQPQPGIGAPPTSPLIQNLLDRLPIYRGQR